MYVFQTIVTLFFLAAAMRTINRYRAGDVTGLLLVGWMIVWVLGIAVVLSPNSTFYLARILGVTRGADAVVYLSVALLFVVAFRLFVKVERLEKEITVLTREIAIKNEDKNSGV